MPKIPTFESQARPTADVPSVKTSFQIPVSNDLFTKAQSVLTDYYVKEKEEEAKIKSLDYENQLLPKLYDAYDKHSKNPFPSEASSAFLKEGKETIQSIIDNELSGENNFVKKRFLEKGNASISSINLATLKSSRLLMEEEKKKVGDIFEKSLFTELQIGAIDLDFAKQKLADYVNTSISDPDPTVSVNKKKFKYDSTNEILETLAMQKDSSKSDFLNKLKDNPDLYPAVKTTDRIKIISYAESIQEKKILEYAKENGRSIVAQSEFNEGADITNLLIPTINAKFSDLKTREEVTNYVKKELTDRSKTFKEKGAAEYYLNTFPNLRQEYALAIQDPNQMAIFQQSMDRIYTEKKIPEKFRTYVPYEKIREIGDILKGTQNVNEKINTISNLQSTYGANMMPSIFKQLVNDGMPVDLQIIMSTNSSDLKKSILSATSTEGLEKLVKRKYADSKLSNIQSNIASQLKPYENIVLLQSEGRVNKQEYILSLQNTLYQAALHNLNNNKSSLSSAASDVTSSFLNDYDLTPKTFFIPKDVNGIPVNKAAVKDKSDLLLLSIEKSDYAERFHGKDGFSHYAVLSGYQDVLPENIKLSTNEKFESYVKDKMINAMRKNSKWLLNYDSTGIILHVELSNATIPIINAKGEKIEFYFADTRNKNSKIKSIDSIEPGTGLPITFLQSEFYEVSP